MEKFMLDHEGIKKVLLKVSIILLLVSAYTVTLPLLYTECICRTAWKRSKTGLSGTVDKNGQCA